MIRVLSLFCALPALACAQSPEWFVQGSARDSPQRGDHAAMGWIRDPRRRPQGRLRLAGSRSTRSLGRARLPLERFIESPGLGTRLPEIG